MPLYEVVLRFPDHDEIRLTDRPDYRTGEAILLAGRRFRVTGVEPAETLRAECRFVLEPCSDGSDRATFAPTPPPYASPRSG